MKCFSITKSIAFYFVVIFLLNDNPLTAAAKFNGNVSFYSAGNLVGYNIEQIYNDSSIYTTGTIAISVVGTYAPYYGVGQVYGTQLYISNPAPGLYPGYSYNNDTGIVEFSDAPTNYTYLWVGLYESNGFQYVISDYRNILVSTYFPEPIDPPSINTISSSTDVSLGSNLTLSANVSGDDLTYQWQYGGNSSTNMANIDPYFGWNNLYNGANSSALSITSIGTDINGQRKFNFGYYRLVVSNSSGTVSSNPIFIGQYTPPPPPIPAITSNPSSTVLNAGESAVLSVTASGTGLTYLWKKDGQNIANSNSTSLNINSVTLSDSGDYTVTVFNSSGSVTSNVASISVRTQLETWKMSYFTGSDLSIDEISGNLGDPDSDGLSNLLEFALNQDPTVSNTIWYDDMNMQNVDGSQHLVVSYSKRINDMSISLVLEESLSLNSDDWSPVTSAPQLLSSDATSEVWQHSLSVDSHGSECFFRLRAVE